LFGFAREELRNGRSGILVNALTMDIGGLLIEVDTPILFVLILKISWPETGII